MRSLDDAGKLVVRVVLGVLLLFHGISKVQHGVEPIAAALAAHGMPSALAYGAFIGELIAPVLLVLGVYARLGGLLVIGHMTVAILLMHTTQLFLLTNSGGWALELQAFYLFNGLAVLLLGAGRFSVGGPNGRWN